MSGDDLNPLHFSRFSPSRNSRSGDIQVRSYLRRQRPRQRQQPLSTLIHEQAKPKTASTSTSRNSALPQHNPAPSSLPNGDKPKRLQPMPLLPPATNSGKITRDPIYWVSIHRYHHRFVDSEKDPHSTKEGFWFSHMGWIFDSTYLIQKNKDRANVEDLKKQPFYNFLRRTYTLHLLGLSILLYALGGFPFLVWGMGVRTVYLYHVIFLINSIGHRWGTYAWKTGDSSRNNWWASVLIFGEGWHNNHHAFETSARVGLEWWQYDPTWYVIWFLEAVGLATNVKLPTKAQKLHKSFSPSHLTN